MPKLYNFKEYYAGRAEKWALCYRNFPHANTDTNMFAESFHSKLKTSYMDRRPNKRVDGLINLLFIIEKDYCWHHKRKKLYRNSQTGKGVTKFGIHSRHTKGNKYTI